jgi:hypothetical protein
VPSPPSQDQPKQPPVPEPSAPKPRPLPEPPDATVRLGGDATGPAARPEPKPEPKARPAEDSIEPIYKLAGLSGQYAGKAFPINRREFVIGRDSDCDITIDRDQKGQPDSSISRKHFTLTTQDERIFLTDRNSKLRTLVNRRRIEPDEREELSPGDIVAIRSPVGIIKFRLVYADEINPFYADQEQQLPLKWILLLLAAIIILVVALILLLGG